MRVLLVESNTIAAQGLTSVLQNAGFMVDHTSLGEEALEMLRHYDYDLSIIDLELADMDGSDLIRRMRHARHPIPALVLSSSSQASTRIRAFVAGADDVVAKPFDQIELVARIHAILRRSKGYSAPLLRVGNLELNLDSKDVTVNSRQVHLTGKEYAILELLVLRKGIVLTKDAFLNHLYGGMDEPEMKIIDVFVCKLRKKLQLAGTDNLIGTVWGRGYMLRDDVVPAILDAVTVPHSTTSHVVAA